MPKFRVKVEASFYVEVLATDEDDAYDKVMDNVCYEVEQAILELDDVNDQLPVDVSPDTIVAHAA